MVQNGGLRMGQVVFHHQNSHDTWDAVLWDAAFCGFAQAKILLRSIEQFGNEQILLCALPVTGFGT